MSELLECYPRLVVSGADAALSFYTAAFGATVTERHDDPAGTVVHAMVEAGPVRFAVKDADAVDVAPGAGGSPVIFGLRVGDADGLAERMVEAGAEVVFPVRDQPYGERAGRLRDPFGHLWMLTQPLH
jgi:PhnB protein